MQFPAVLRQRANARKKSFPEGKLFLLSVENDYFNSAKYLMVRTIWLV